MKIHEILIFQAGSIFFLLFMCYTDVGGYVYGYK